MVIITYGFVAEPVAWQSVTLPALAWLEPPSPPPDLALPWPPVPPDSVCPLPRAFS
jgi:hypothetical protein